MSVDVTVVLITVVLLLGGHPTPHARIQCLEISRQVDTPCTWIDENTGRCLAWEPAAPEDGAGAVLETDSRGRMTFTSPPTLLHCRAWSRWTNQSVDAILDATTSCPDQVFTVHLDYGRDRYACERLVRYTQMKR